MSHPAVKDTQDKEWKEEMAEEVVLSLVDSIYRRLNYKLVDFDSPRSELPANSFPEKNSWST